MNLKELYKQAIAQNGQVLQKVVAIEELNELSFELVLMLLKIQKLITKDLRGIGNIRQIAEEMADVLITLDQMKLMLNIEDLVERYKVEKLERLQKNLKGSD